MSIKINTGIQLEDLRQEYINIILEICKECGLPPAPVAYETIRAESIKQYVQRHPSGVEYRIDPHGRGQNKLIFCGNYPKSGDPLTFYVQLIPNHEDGRSTQKINRHFEELVNRHFKELRKI